MRADDPLTASFGRVLAAEGISNFGSMLSRVAIPWIATLVLAATPLAMGGLVVADVLAGALGAVLLAGSIDRAGKRAVMLGCDLLRAAVFALLALLAWQGGLTLPLLVAAAAANGLLTVGFEMARSAWVAQRVEARRLPQCNAQLSMAGSVSEAAAFALGGWVFQWTGAAIALAVDALSFAFSAACLRGVPETAPVVACEMQADVPAEAPLTPLDRLIGDARAGLRTVLAQPALRALAVIEVLLALGSSLAATSYMIFVARDVGFSPGTLGMIFATGALGAVAGAALAPWLGRRLGPGRAMALGLTLAALGAACIPLVAASGLLGGALLVVHQVIGDAGRSLHDVVDRTLRQTAAPAALLARTDAGLRTAGQLATLVGAIAGGALAAAVGTRSSLWLSAALIAGAAGVAAVTLGRRRLDQPA